MSRKHVFSSLEKKAFMDILRKYSLVIESKDTDGATLRAKNEAWDRVTREYNASPNSTIQVTSKQLRRLWMNLKQRQRDALKKERQQRMATSGVPVPPSNDAIVNPEISLGPPTTFTGIMPILPTSSQPASIATPPSPRYIRPRVNSVTAFQHIRNTLLKNEYNNRQKRAQEKHELEMEILRHKATEAKAKADLAQIILWQHGASANDDLSVSEG